MVYHKYNEEAGLLAYLLCGAGPQSFRAKPELKAYCRSGPKGESRAHTMVVMLSEFIAGELHYWDTGHQTLQVGGDAYCIVCRNYGTIEGIGGVPVGKDSLVKAPPLPRGKPLTIFETITDDRWDIIGRLGWDYMDRFPEEIDGNIKLVERDGFLNAFNQVVDLYQSMHAATAGSSPQTRP